MEARCAEASWKERQMHRSLLLANFRGYVLRGDARELFGGFYASGREHRARFGCMHTGG